MRHLYFNSDGFPVILSGGNTPEDAILLSDSEADTVSAAISNGDKVQPDGASWKVVHTEPVATPDQVNTERTRRLAQGTTIEVTGYGSVAVQGRDQDQITVLALEASARDLTAAGVTDPVIPFRDRDNVQHMLTPEQTMELMRKAKAFAQQIYQASWALKDADPIPLDYEDDKHWP